jgi:hypothetical protein
MFSFLGRRVAFLFAATLMPIPAVAQRECKVDELSPGTTVSASLTPDDCRFNDLFTTSSNRALVKQYRLTAGERAVHTVELSSPEFDTILYVYSNDRSLLFAINDDITGSTNSRVIINLPQASYLVLVVAKGADAMGAFELKSTPEAPRDCQASDLNFGVDQQGSFSASTCRGVDWSGNTVSTDTRLQNRYRLRLERRSVVQLDFESALTLTSSLAPAEGTGRVFSGRTRLLLSQLSGTYLLSVFSSEAGSFVLRSTLTDPRSCTAQDLELSGSREGRLEEPDCRMLDLFTPSSDATFVDLYRLTVSANQVVTMQQKSGDVDSFLLLLNERNVIIALNDDASQDTLDSRLQIHLTGGAYRLLANTLDSRPGGYTLDIESEPPRPCDSEELTLNRAVEGTLADSGCRVLDAIAFSTDSAIATAYQVTLPRRQILRLDLNMRTTRGNLNLVDAEGLLIGVDSVDRDGNADTELLLRPGKYIVLLSASATPRPMYTLRGALRDQPVCSMEDLGLPSAVEAQLTNQDCKLFEQVLALPIPTPAKSYRVTLPARGRLTVELGSTVIPPLLVLADAEDGLLLGGLSPVPATLRATPTLNAGTYRILAGTASTNGSFTLRTSFEPVAAPSTTGTSEAGTVTGGIQFFPE